MNNGIYNVAVTNSGVTAGFNVARPYTEVHFVTTGAIVLAGNVSFSLTGTPDDRMTIRLKFLFASTFELNSRTFTVLGQTLTEDILNADPIIEAVYDEAAATWILTLVQNDLASNTVVTANIKNSNVTTAKIADNAVTLDKLVDFGSRGYALRGGAAGAPEEFDAKTSGQVLVGDGTDLVSAPLTGDVTGAMSGGNLVMTIGAGKVTNAMLATPPLTYYSATLTIPTASVLTLNASPLTIVAAPGSGKYIEVISATSQITYVAAAYATNTTLQLICNGADVAQVQDTAILISTVTKNTKFQQVTAATAGQTQIIANTALQVKVATGNPVTGDSDITVTVIYAIRDVA